MKNFSKKIIFFLHLNNNTMEKGAIPEYIDPITKKIEYPSLLCKIKNKFYKTIYTMYLLNLPIENKEKTISLILQLKPNMNYPFEIVIKNDYLENHNLYYFYFEKIIFKEKLKNGILDMFFNKKNNILDPPFSCDINIFEQTQLILAYINNQNRKEKFDILSSLKIELGFSKFSRLNELFLIYLRIIFVENYNISLIQELLDNYKYIYYDINNSFNISLFCETSIKPIFLKAYTNRNYIIYNNFEYDLRNSLSEKYNKIFDKLCFKYFIFYDKEFLLNEDNIKSRISTQKQKNKFYEIYYEVLQELNINNLDNLFFEKKLLSESYIQSLIHEKEIEIDKIKQNRIFNGIINLNNFYGLKFLEFEKNSMPIYFLGKFNNGCSILSVDDKELYLYDSVLNVKIRVQYNISHNTTSLFQLQDGNIIIVYSNHQKICIIDMKHIYKNLEQIYAFDTENFIDLENNEEYILKVIEIKNKNLVQLSKKSISFYYNNIQSNGNDQLYNYKKYNEIKHKDNINNFSILEFNDNFVIVCSGRFVENSSNDCYLTFINIKKMKENSFQIEYINHKINGIILYNSVLEDNNILIKLTDDILGIGGKNIYLYSLKNKEVFQVVEFPSILSKYYYSVVSSFLIHKNKFIYIVVKYFLEEEELTNFLTKIYIYTFNDNKYLKNENGLIFLSESKYNLQQEFFKAIEIQN